MTGITGYDYEYLWALYLKCKGYGAKVTSKSGDEGADVIAIKDYKRIAYQCKLYSKPIGRKAIYEAHAGKDTYQCSKAIVVTNNTFTKQAIETAKKLSVGLLSNKTPESLIEVCAQGYKEGKINRKEVLLLQLPASVQKAIIFGSKKESENVNRNIVEVKSDEIYDKDKVFEMPMTESVYIKQQTHELLKRYGHNSGEEYNDLVLEIENNKKTKKVCPVCGREFLEHFVKCPICKCELADLGGKKIEKNKAYVDNGVELEKKKNKKMFYCCIGVAVFLYVGIFFLNMYSEFAVTSHTEKIQVAVSSRELKGNTYSDVVKKLQDAGFSNIELIEDADLVFGLLKQEGEVGEVSINGKIAFEKDECFPKDAKIKITYHTFKPEFKSEEDNVNISQEGGETKFVEYDTLQNLFLLLSFDTAMESIDSYISENNLEFTKEEYNGTLKKYVYKIAYKSGVALQRYADNGDYVEVCFSRLDGSLLYAEYFNDSAFMVALLYNYGTYWDFRESEPSNIYSGFYYSEPGKYDGLIIEYANGLSTQTSYHPCSNAEEALLNVILSKSM